MEQILKTIREIARAGLPKNALGQPVVFDTPIMSWFHGDRQVISINELPAITFDSESRATEYGTLRAREHTWNLTVNCYVRLDDTEFTLTMLHEITRLIDEALREHSMIWVFEPCLFDMEDFSNPLHLAVHDELGPYKAAAEASFLAKWNATHQTQGTGPVAAAPTMAIANAYAVAYHNFYLQGILPEGGTYTYQNAAGYTHYETPAGRLETLRRDLVRPVRLISFTRVENIEYGVVPKMDNSFLRASQLKISAREIDPVFSFGPNNVT